MKKNTLSEVLKKILVRNLKLKLLSEVFIALSDGFEGKNHCANFKGLLQNKVLNYKPLSLKS